ncbi:MAG TPA: glutamyl-tRNA reductase [Stellaceae bacterium]|nr:glutamyl-tRNA reductase [Stellaceae bacterium]
MPGATAAGTGGELLVIGANHRTSPLDWRDRFTLIEAELADELDRLRVRGFREAVLIATCDRIELVSTVEAEPLCQRFAEHLAERLGESIERVSAALYRHRGAAALRHLFAVASSLDSLMIGEPQVMGQLRAAHRVASEVGLVSAPLEAAFQAAYGVARRIRRETAIGQRPVSMAAAAVELAREVHGDLDRSSALLIGVGEMGELMAEHFRRAGIRQLLVSGPGAASELLARRLGATHVPVAALADGLAEADIVIASVGSGRRVLAATLMEAALRRRRRRPVFVIDAAIPPDVEPAVNDLDGAFLYTLDDLERSAMAGRAGREAAAAAAQSILDAELASFERRQAERSAVPAVTALRAHFEAMRAALLRDEPGLDAEAATRLLVNRLLHAPSESLRGLAAAEGDAAAAEALLRRIFRLVSEEGDQTS